MSEMAHSIEGPKKISVIVSDPRTHKTQTLAHFLAHILSVAGAKNKLDVLVVSYDEHSSRQLRFEAERRAGNFWPSTISHLPVGGNVRGRSFDLIFVDDPVSESSTMGRVTRWFGDELIPRLNPSGRAMVVGSPYRGDDFIHSVIDMEQSLVSIVPTWRIRHRE